MKLMIVGQEAVGKTSLTRAIVSKSKKKAALFGNKRAVKNLSTDGIDIEIWDRKARKKTNKTKKKLCFGKS